MGWIGTSFLLGLGLSMDCLALSIGDGLAYKDLKKWQAFFIAFIYALFQALFPMVGFFLGSTFIDKIEPWHLLLSFLLLAFIGGKMIYDGIHGMVHPEEKKPEQFKVGSVLLQGVADSIDAFAAGITINATLNGANPDAVPLWETFACLGIIGLCTFVVSLVGVFAGKGINKLLKGRYEIANLLGGLVLVGLGIRSFVQFFLALYAA